MFSIDLFRHVRECIDPTEYLSRGYYDQWLLAHAVMMVDAGVARLAGLVTRNSMIGTERDLGRLVGRG